MDDVASDFLQKLLETPSPSGYEWPVQHLVRDFVDGIADEVETDSHGNVIATKNPDASLRVMLAGHCDQIGLIVQHIDDDGYIYVSQIGGWDIQMLIGQRLTVWAAEGPVEGVIARKAIHLLEPEERKQVPKFTDLALDIGAKNKADALSVLKIGDPITLALGMHRLRGDLIASPGVDDKSGLWIVMEAFRRAAKRKLNVGVYAVSTVQEEVGLRGARTSAYHVDAQVGIAVDVTHATDCPGVDKKQVGDIRLGRGPAIYRGPNMNPKVVDRLVAGAEKAEIPYQLLAAGGATGTDANVMQVSRRGMATGLIGIPNRYMHSPVEVVSLGDLDHSAQLLADFLESLEPDADFTP
ncbi:MAG: M42 family metallopeptidase [Planctomycetales bacterium]|nr:M42 family metallopeptidase [Planctomycetales bacterium]